MFFKFETMLFEYSRPLSNCKIDGAPISVKISMRLKAISSAFLYSNGLRIINLVR
jgi:hypothetical protein